MKRRLIVAATALALIGGTAAVASAATPSSATVGKRPHQFCVVFLYDDGSDPGHICVNY